MRTVNFTRKTGAEKENEALQKFADVMIRRIETISKDWKKPWFTHFIGWPRNIDGGRYSGSNNLMLLFNCMENGYNIPVFVTGGRLNKMNEGAKKDKPFVHVLKGEHAFPVMFYKPVVVNKETGAKISWEDLQKLSMAEMAEYKVFPTVAIYQVFNVAQTNLKEARPELWAKLEKEYENKRAEDEAEEKTSFAPMDTIIRENLWICPILPKYQDRAYFSEAENRIVVPEKKQFVNGEEFYGTVWHEMTHSTGTPDHLNRLKPTKFGSDDYAREELVAELGSALVAAKYGMSKALEEGNCKYLKNWLGSLKEDPKFIKTVLSDVKKAADMIIGKVDEVAGLTDGCEAAEAAGATA